MFALKANVKKAERFKAVASCPRCGMPITTAWNQKMLAHLREDDRKQSEFKAKTKSTEIVESPLFQCLPFLRLIL